MKQMRKLVALVFAVIMCCTLSVSAFAVTGDNDIIDDWDKDITLGDLNNDGAVNTDDFVLMRKYLAGLIGSTEFSYSAADLNNDENVNTDDLVVLRKKIAGLI